MTQTFYFYDLETSGFRPAQDRIMQFAGQRTSMELKPIGAPDNILIKLSPDVLPSPDAVLVHGITPQNTLAEGMTEADFITRFQNQIAKPGTIFTGFNSIRFDDEFMRYVHYRNLWDAYSWQWQDDKGRWDLLDVVRMTRALRPEGINWPFDSEGKPVNRLELLSSLNGIEHSNAHDALADVRATIGIAQLIREKQPKLFDFLLSYRTKKAVQKLVLAGQPFVYSSGKYSSDYEKTTVVSTVCEHPDGQGVLVFDLRQNPSHYVSLSADELLQSWQLPWDDPKRLPVKTLKYNRCPAVAPLSVLDPDSQTRLHLQPAEISQHAKTLLDANGFDKQLAQAVNKLNQARQTRLVETEFDVESRLYDDFIDGSDKRLLNKLHLASPKDVSPSIFKFKDQRLNALLPLYKARNFPDSLSQQEESDWLAHVTAKLELGSEDGKFAKYLKRIEELKLTAKTKHDLYLLEELKLFGLSLLPTDSFG